MKTLSRYTGARKQKGVSLLFRIIYAATYFWMFTLFFWWGSYLLLDVSLVPTITSVGIVISVLAGALVFIKEKDALSKHSAIWLMIYLFYNVCFLGFFMGVPVFNVLLTPFPALYLVSRARREGWSNERVVKYGKVGVIVTTLVMSLVCLSSAAIALSDSYTASNLTGMLGIYFDNNGVILLVCMGGLLLIVASAILFAVVSRIGRRVLGENSFHIPL